jgi:hypothetical protein
MAAAAWTAGAEGDHKADATGAVEAAGYAACTLGLLALTGLAARRAATVLSLKQSFIDSSTCPATSIAIPGC